MAVVVDVRRRATWGGVGKEGHPVWYCCDPALAVLESVEDADWHHLPPLGEDEGEEMIGVRRENNFSSKSVSSLRLGVLLKAEGFAWPHRPPIVVGGHSPRSVGMLCRRSLLSGPQDSQSLHVAPRGEFVGPGGMKMLQAASVELAVETCSPGSLVRTNVETSPPKLQG